jgi:UDP-glucuronate 4-epimerase
MTILVTGAAGFIGHGTARALLERGEAVLGIDNLNDYYDVRLKEARVADLRGHNRFRFERADVADAEAIGRLFAANPDIAQIVHLAAQAGVRYSAVNPMAYMRSNLDGQLVMIEAARRLPKLEHFVYASTSSVYGDSKAMPFSIRDPVDKPRSLYAATKRGGELIAIALSQLYAMPMTCLRFFTVYGPWGRPDMAAWLFTAAILEGRPLQLFNAGRMERDFTYIDDIVAGVLAAIGRLPEKDENGRRHAIYNLGNSHPEDLRRFLGLIEAACGRKAIIENAPMQPGDVVKNFADIAESRRDLGFEPRTPIEIGVPKFVEWFRKHHGK